MKSGNVIVLWGRGSKGKTQTLNLVIQKLLSNFHATLLKGTLSSNIENDCCIVLKYKNRKIGIITNGDDGKILESKFALLPDDCDIYICASRTRGSSCEYINTRFSQNAILWQEKWSVTGGENYVDCLEQMQKQANDMQALGIIEAIDLLCTII